MTRRGFQPPGRPGNKPGAHNERRNQAANAAKEQIKLFKQQRAEQASKLAATAAAAPPARPRNAAALLAALDEIPFYYAGETASRSVGPIYKGLAQTAIECMTAKSQEAVLIWPDADPAPAAIAVLLSLADCASCTSIKRGDFDAFAEPVGMRALIYPYTRTERHRLRDVLVDKGHINRVQLKHQLRLAANDDEGLADFHKTLVRVGTLDGKGTDGVVYPEFEHPCADELVPTSRIGKPDSMSGLLWRVRTKTDLRRFDRRGSPADHPDKAPFFLFGLHADDSLEPALKAVKRPLDLVILDLTRTGQNRLSRDWLKRSKQFLSEVERLHGPMGVVILTDDPWTFDTVRRDLLLTNKQKRQKAIPPPGQVIIAHDTRILARREAAPQVYAPVSYFEISPYAGALDEVLALAKALARRAADLGDLPALDRIRDIIGTLRRCAALPAPLSALTDFVADEVGERQVVDRLAPYSPNTALTALSRSVGALAQIEGSLLATFDERVRALHANAQQLTPMASSFEGVLSALIGKSSRTIFLFRDSMMADFAAESCAAKPEFRDLDRRFSTKMIYFSTRSELNDLAREPASYRNQIKSLVIVGLARRALLSTLSQPWLPERVYVIGDSDTIISTARDASRLMKYPALSPLQTRLESYTAKAHEEASRIVGPSLNLSEDVAPTEDDDLAGGHILNLAGANAGSQSLVSLELDTGDTIIARPGTAIVLQDTGRLVPTFYEETARQVDVGDRVCVIGDAFVEMVRPLLNIAVRAAEEIRDYHKLVLDKFEKLPGTLLQDRLQHLVDGMGIADVSTTTARYWVNLTDELTKPLEEVIPHAPRELPTYLAFMRVLGVSEAVAQRYWSWAVVAQRSLKVRAALRYHEAYRTILVSPYAAEADNPERARDIRRIRTAAEEFVGRVVRKQTSGGSNARA